MYMTQSPYMYMYMCVALYMYACKFHVCRYVCVYVCRCVYVRAHGRICMYVYVACT